ncbi:dihydrofolate reductase family protein [Pseudolysinimonas kribbensis]|uniref:Dihydrofolate reductase n=1 Tax=Pseudolysinimonas kribbensis TaxID=433641 RepID=A0ABQ6K4X7_9MICO|nr:dihydrofolate reductase family protein [Pseudolysinimonas kribbensis]GMA94354.1 dihydrofolate reductase [Pseudolysinimonas kribbensis]
MELSPQTAAGKVLMHFCISLDGYVAGPGHDMAFMEGATTREGLHREYIETTGAVLAGRSGFDSAIGDSRPYGGAWQGPIFVLTHHPDDAEPIDDITVLSCPVDEAVRIALDAAGGKNVEVFSPSICAQLLDLGLIDEIDIHIAPVLLGDGVRLYEALGGRIRHLLLDGPVPSRTVDLRYRPAPAVAGDAR